MLVDVDEFDPLHRRDKHRTITPLRLRPTWTATLDERRGETRTHVHVPRLYLLRWERKGKSVRRTVSPGAIAPFPRVTLHTCHILHIPLDSGWDDEGNTRPARDG